MHDHIASIAGRKLQLIYLYQQKKWLFIGLKKEDRKNKERKGCITVVADVQTCKRRHTIIFLWLFANLDTIYPCLCIVIQKCISCKLTW
jgi:hypothetical protein